MSVSGSRNWPIISDFYTWNFENNHTLLLLTAGSLKKDGWKTWRDGKCQKHSKRNLNFSRTKSIALYIEGKAAKRSLKYFCISLYFVSRASDFQILVSNYEDSMLRSGNIVETKYMQNMFSAVFEQAHIDNLVSARHNRFSSKCSS